MEKPTPLPAIPDHLPAGNTARMLKSEKNGKKIQISKPVRGPRPWCRLLVKPGTDSAARPVYLSRCKTRILLRYLAKMLQKIN